MQSTEIHLPTVEPGKAPGGLWIRLCTRKKLLAERALEKVSEAHQLADSHGDIAIEALKNGEGIWLYFYDGDSGECLGTLLSC